MAASMMVCVEALPVEMLCGVLRADTQEPSLSKLTITPLNIYASSSFIDADISGKHLTCLLLPHLETCPYLFQISTTLGDAH